MQRIGHGVGIVQGSRLLFADFADGGAMWTGRGEREVRVPVTFGDPFLDPPAVIVGMSMWDMHNGSNMRADISAAEVTRTGFVVVFRTWGDSRIARVRADWTAIGATRDEEDWDVA